MNESSQWLLGKWTLDFCRSSTSASSTAEDSDLH